MSSDRLNHNQILTILIPETRVELHISFLFLFYFIKKNMQTFNSLSEYCVFH
jgi:hypothetical protein